MNDKKDALSVAMTAINDASISAMVSDLRAKGATEKEVAQAIFDKYGPADNMDTDLSVFLILAYMNRCFGWETNDGENNTFLGYACQVQHYIHRKEAIEWRELLETVVTVGDVWEYFKKVNYLQDFVISTQFEYDAVFFQDLLSKKVDHSLGFGFTEKQASENMDKEND